MYMRLQGKDATIHGYFQLRSLISLPNANFYKGSWEESNVKNPNCNTSQHTRNEIVHADILLPHLNSFGSLYVESRSELLVKISFALLIADDDDIITTITTSTNHLNLFRHRKLNKPNPLSGNLIVVPPSSSQSKIQSRRSA